MGCNVSNSNHSNSEWIKLKSFRQTHDSYNSCKFYKLNDKELAGMNPYIKMKTSIEFAIYRVNTDSIDICSLIIPHTIARNYTFIQSVSYDTNKKILYLIVGSGKHMLKYKMDTNAYEIKYQLITNTKVKKFLHRHTNSILVNNQLHIWSAYDNRNNSITWDHHIWSIDDHAIVPTNTKPLHLSGRDWTLIYLEQQQKIMLFNNYKNKIKIYDIGKKIWETVTIPWPNILSCNEFTAVADGNYIYFVTDEHYDDSTLFVLDLKLMEFMECTIECTCFRNMFFTRENPADLFVMDSPHGMLLISGYMRECMDGIDVPLDVISIVNGFYYHKYLHLVETEYNQHWKISINTVLCNLI